MTLTHKSFLITGEFLTEHARNLFWEKAVRDAERFLLAATNHTITVDQIAAILTGRAKIVGDTYNDNLEIAEDDDTLMQEWVKQLYAGTLCFKRDYYRPYARVTNWGPLDLSSGFKLGRVKSRVVDTKIDPCARNCAYMRDPKEDQVAHVKINGESAVVLWGKTQAPPAWLPIIETVDWQRSIDEYLAANCTLQITGHNERFPDWTGEDSWLTRRKEVNPEEVKAAEVTQEVIEPEPDNHYLRGINPVTNSQMKLVDNGYILSNGTMYLCCYHGHKLLAEAILKLVYGKQNIDDDPNSMLINLRAIGIHQSGIDGSYRMYGPERIVGKQYDTLSFWCAMHDIDVETFIAKGHSL